VLKVSTSGYYEWRSRRPSARDLADAHLIDEIRALHAATQGTYGVRRVHAELVHHRKWRHGGAGRLPAVFEDQVKRVFAADAPDKLWVTDITQHRTGEGWVYCACVVDVFSRRCVGWSIADHIRTELVVDAIEMARWRRKPVGTIVHSSWLFGARLREAGLMGSMGKVASAYDNALMESFFGSMQIELLDRRDWTTRAELGTAIFEWIEAFYNPVRRHSGIGYHSPNQFEALHAAALQAA
jgi:putative transposase